jgi:hypothetical protein
MNAPALIDLAADAGLTLTAIAGSLHLQATRPPSAELLAELTAHKLEIIEVLTTPPPESRAWLDNVANLLGCSADYLLERRFIDRDDLREQYTTHPLVAARLIGCNPFWTSPAHHGGPNEQNDTVDSQ